MSKVQINYKSGISMTVEVESITVNRNSVTGNVSAEWKGMKPNALLFGIDDVESIWEVK